MPVRLIGNVVAYPDTPLIVISVSGALLTPGVTEANDAFGLFETWSFVRSHVTGKVNDVPFTKGPLGKVALLAVKYPVPICIPTILVMAMFAVQVTFLVDLAPKAT